MKLHLTLRSPYARKCRVLALEKGIDLELVQEDLVHKSPELLAKNPLGKIPILELDDGRVLLDSSVISAYLDSLTESPKFIPSEEKDRLRVLNTDALGKNLTDVTVVLFYEMLYHPEDFNKNYVNRLEETIGRSLQYFNDHIAEVKGFHLGSFSVATALGYLCFRHGRLWSDEKYPQLAKWYAQISQRKSMAETRPVG